MVEEEMHGVLDMATRQSQPNRARGAPVVDRPWLGANSTRMASSSAWQRTSHRLWHKVKDGSQLQQSPLHICAGRVGGRSSGRNFCIQAEGRAGFWAFGPMMKSGSHM